jgi:hypothetical protein
MLLQFPDIAACRMLHVIVEENCRFGTTNRPGIRIQSETLLLLVLFHFYHYGIPALIYIFMEFCDHYDYVRCHAWRKPTDEKLQVPRMIAMIHYRPFWVRYIEKKIRHNVHLIAYPFLPILSHWKNTLRLKNSHTATPGTGECRWFSWKKRMQRNSLLLVSGTCTSSDFPGSLDCVFDLRIPILTATPCNSIRHTAQPKTLRELHEESWNLISIIWLNQRVDTSDISES